MRRLKLVGGSSGVIKKDLWTCIPKMGHYQRLSAHLHEIDKPIRTVIKKNFLLYQTPLKIFKRSKEGKKTSN